MKEILEKLNINFDLNEQEQKLILIISVILLPIILFFLILYPLQNQKTKLLKKYQKKLQKIQKISLLGQEYNFLNTQNFGTKFSLENNVRKILVEKKLIDRTQITSQKSDGKSQRIVLKINNLTLKEFTNVIYTFENSQPVIRIQSIDTNIDHKVSNFLQIILILTSS